MKGKEIPSLMLANKKVQVLTYIINDRSWHGEVFTKKSLYLLYWERGGSRMPLPSGWG
jgi:hypothetical protein